MGTTIEFTRPDGRAAPGYLAEPRGRSFAPGIVMFEEWWGLNDQIKETADRLAAGGYRVLVPDLYRGTVADTREEANHLMEGLDFADAATQDARGAANDLAERNAKKVGVIGFCMGGALAMLAAMFDPEFAAAVVWYGYPPPQAGDPSKIKIPLQGHWATHDEFFKIGDVDAIEEQLKSGGVPYEFHRYDAKHAFYNPKGLGNHHPQHAQTAWQRTIAFLDRTLK